MHCICSIWSDTERMRTCVCVRACVCLCVCGKMEAILTHQCCSVTSSLYESGLLKTHWIYGQFESDLRHGVCMCTCACVKNFFP